MCVLLVRWLLTQRQRSTFKPLLLCNCILFLYKVGKRRRRTVETNDYSLSFSQNAKKGYVGNCSALTVVEP
jgi:hypothetical protein